MSESVIKKISEATADGAMAARDRKPFWDCKYPPGSAERKEWNAAYQTVDYLCEVVTGFTLQGRDVNVVPVDVDQ